MLRPGQLIAFRARLEPDRPAIVAGDSVVTFGMLEQAIRSVSHRIAGMGLMRGSVAGLAIDAPGRALAVGLALERSGVVVAASEPQAALPAAGFVFSGRPLPAGVPGVVVDDSWFGVTVPGMPALPAIADTDGCRSFSSVTLTHTQVARGARWLAAMLDTAASAAKVLQLHGIASVEGYLSTLAALAEGRTVYFPMPGQDPLQLAQVYRCQLMLCGARQLAILTQRQQQRYLALPELAGIAVHGPMPAATLSLARSLISRRILTWWGTPALPFVSVEVAGNQDAQSGTVGFLCPWVEARVAGDTGHLQFRTTEGAGADEPWLDTGVAGTTTQAGRVILAGAENEVQA